MKAVLMTSPGGPEVLQLQMVENPRVGGDEVLIMIGATALNRADTLQRKGSSPPPEGTNPYPGLECAGTVESVGKNVTRWTVGDEVFKGKKMPGRMGGKQCTVKNVWVYKIDPARNLMWVKGQVPGAEGNFIFIKDAVYKKPDISLLPFPTHFIPSDEDTSELEPLVADLGEIDPFMTAD